MSLGLLCPGQGDQSPDMVSLLKGRARAEAILAIFEQETERDPFALSGAEMQVNAMAQPLVCAVQLAIWAEIAERSPVVGGLAGYSVGELAAYGCAGALTPRDVIGLARRRAVLMDDALRGGGTMLALRGLDRAAVRAICARHGAEIAIVNDSDRFVIGGTRDAIAACGEDAQDRGAKATPLAIQIPSHTGLMRPSVAPFRDALKSVDWKRPSAPVMAGLDGAPVLSIARAQEVLAAQLAQTIDWAACLDGLRERGCTILLELGPGAGLARMARDRAPDVPARSVTEFHTLDGVIDWLSRHTGD